MYEYQYDQTIIDNNREQNVKKYNLFNVLGVVGVIVSALWAGYAFTFIIPTISLTFLIFGFIPLVLFILITFFLFRKRDTYCVDYDYLFISGEVRISKVINDKKRKNCIEFKCTQLEKVGVYGSNTFEKFNLNLEFKKLYLTSNQIAGEGNNFYYVVLTQKDKKFLVILECSNKFISCIINYSDKTIFDEELKKL